MAVQRDRITVFPPDGETVVVDLLDGGVSLGTAHAERTTTRTLTLPLTISERTSFFVPAGSGPYDVSVKLDGDEIAGPAGTPVTVSDFPAEVRTRINAAELGSVAGSGGSINIVTATDDYTATDGDYVLGDATAGALTVTLPAPAANLTVSVKKVDTSADAVTIGTPGAETVDGEASMALTQAYQSRVFVCDGTDWWVI